jgi:Kef-type K+ transport system membrane component KefB
MMKFLLPLFFPFNAFAAGAGSSPVGENLLWLALILMSTRLFSPLAQRIGFPAVLGELLLGVALGNLPLLGIGFFGTIAHDPIIAFIAELGVIVLLLQIGLETRLKDLVAVGSRAFAVGVIGIVMPFVLGAWVVGPWLLPGKDANAYLFLGATLSATSVGITGRVFRDLGKLDLPAARIVLGAAVIDDVLGLVILAVVSSLVSVGTVSAGAVGLILAKAVLFLGGSIGLGPPDRAVEQPLAGTARCRSVDAVRPGFIHGTGLVVAGACHGAGAHHRHLCRRVAVRAGIFA